MCIRDRCKAIKVLPDYSIVHKQDWFVKENYAPDLQMCIRDSMCTEPYFSHYPFFGLPTEVEDCDII